jgi:hypothetical protein
MVKKISFIILSVAILVAGVIGFSKLSYSDRSIRIFSYKSDLPQAGRGGERHRDFRPERGPGVVRERRGQVNIDRNIPDSLRQRFQEGGSEMIERGSFEGRPGGGEGRGRGDFQGGSKINLRNIPWFLAVFAAFTVASLYVERGLSLFTKKRIG